MDIAIVKNNASIASIRLRCWGEVHAASPGEIKTRNTKKLSIKNSKWKVFIFKIQLVRQHHSMFSPLRLFNSSINSSMSKYNNIRSLTFLSEPQRISKQPSDSLLNDSVFWTKRLSQRFISPCINIWWICRLNESFEWTTQWLTH